MSITHSLAYWECSLALSWPCLSAVFIQYALHNSNHEYHAHHILIFQLFSAETTTLHYPSHLTHSFPMQLPKPAPLHQHHAPQHPQFSNRICLLSNSTLLINRRPHNAFKFPSSVISTHSPSSTPSAYIMNSPAHL